MRSTVTTSIVAHSSKATFTTSRDTKTSATTTTSTFDGTPILSTNQVNQPRNAAETEEKIPCCWEFKSTLRAKEVAKTMQSMNSFFMYNNVSAKSQQPHCESTESSSSSSFSRSTSELTESASGSSLPGTSNLKRKHSEPLLREEEDGTFSKRRKTDQGSTNSLFAESVSFQHKWGGLLASVIKKSSSSSSSVPSSSSTTSSSIAGLLPIQNSLLTKYDPIKILSRPSLCSTLQTVASSSDTNVHQMNPHPSLWKSSAATSTITSSRQTTNYSESKSSSSSTKRNESDIMPPPRFPWSQPGSSKSTEDSSFPKTQSSSSSTSKPSIFEVPNRTQRLPYHSPKVNVAVSGLKKSAPCIVKYDSRQLEISRNNFRLATISKTVRKKQRSEQIRFSKSTSTTSNNPATDSLNQRFTASKEKNASPDSIFRIPKTTIENNPVAVACTQHHDITLTIPENPIVNHTIQLLRHKRDLQTRIELIEEEGIVHRMQPLPKLKQPLPKGQLTTQNIPLTSEQTKDILDKRISILLAHGGFTHARQQTMEVLSDVMENFFVSLTRRLKQVREMEMYGVEQEFPDPLERTFVEMGLGGVRGTQKFYQTRVVDYRKRMEEQCINLRKQYAHKIRLKVGMVASASGGSNTASSSSTTSSHLKAPGNSVIAEILSGLEDATASSLPCNEEERRKQSHPPRYQPVNRQESSLQQTLPQTTPQKSSQPQRSFSSSNLQQNPGPSHQQQDFNSMQSQPIRQPMAMKHNSQQSKQVQPPHPTTSNVHRTGSLTSVPSSSNQAMAKSSLPRAPVHSGNAPVNYSNNMVSINLNNNVDLGGFVPITSQSPGNSRTPTTVSINKGVITCGGSGSDSKTKLKEALSQRNLLRLNFEQVPSSCDSTVLLSSSSPSISSSSSSSSKTPTPSSSISQSTRLKL